MMTGSSQEYSSATSVGNHHVLIEIPDELAQWLLESANQRGVSIKNLLAELLAEKQHAACIEASDEGKEVPKVEPATAIEGLCDELAREYPPGSLGRFAQLALKSGLASEEFLFKFCNCGENPSEC